LCFFEELEELDELDDPKAPFTAFFSFFPLPIGRDKKKLGFFCFKLGVIVSGSDNPL
jgi:hypothetical protein